jgi:hypothetical protein
MFAIIHHWHPKLRHKLSIQRTSQSISYVQEVFYIAPLQPTNTTPLREKRREEKKRKPQKKESTRKKTSPLQPTPPK